VLAIQNKYDTNLDVRLAILPNVQKKEIKIFSVGN
jgi:hypothetical protein